MMERSRGVELGKVAGGVKAKTRLEVMKSLIEFEMAFFSSRFPMYGSLYYVKDLPGVQPEQLVPQKTDSEGDEQSRFAIGPSTDRRFFVDGRDEAELDRGPCMCSPFIFNANANTVATGSTAEDFVLATAYRELACIEKLPRSREQKGIYYGPGQWQPSAKREIYTLLNYMKIARFLLPGDPIISKPVLWHSDMHGQNIFVNPDQPAEVINIIDWQSVHISPLFCKSVIPQSLNT
jgi:hypothetical protein